MAGRIPQAFIDDLLERVDIIEVIDRRLKLKKSGRNYSALCPFHDEKTPSFSVNGEKQFYYCFGCGASGNAIGFVMDFDRIDFPQAVENLAALAGVNVPRVESPHHTRTGQSGPAERPQRDLHHILDAAARFYRDQLKQHPQARRAVDYLKKRGLSGEIAKQFGIGYAPPGWDNLLRHLGGEARDRQLLLEAGLLVTREEDNRSYDRFRDRVIFPIHDSRGRVIAFGGRVLTDEKPKYLNSPETAVFHKGRELYGLYEARKAQRQVPRLIVVEGYMDVVALAQFGIPYAVATLGTATSTEHLKKVFRLCPEVVFCFDGDRAGRQAARRALEAVLPVMEDGRQARFLFLPEGEDPDSLVRARGSAAFEQLLTSAQPLEEHLFASAGEGIDDITTLEGRARLSKQAAPLISLLPEGVYRELMLGALAQRTGVSSQRLGTLLAETPPPSAPAEPSPPRAARPLQRRPLPPRTASTRLRNPTLHAVGLLVLWPRDALRTLSDQPLDHLAGPEANLLRELLQLLRNRPESSTAMLMGYLYQAPWRELMQRAIDGDSVRILNEHPDTSAQKELADTLERLQGRRVTQHLEALIDKFRDADYAGLSPQEKQQLNQLIAQNRKK
jgi:DNA primase